MSKKDEKNGSKTVIPLFKIDEEPELEEEEANGVTQRVFSKSGPEFVFKQSYDKSGYSVTCSLRVAPWMSDRMASVVESKSSPYNNASEFFRDAIYHRLMFWAEKLEDRSMKEELLKRGYSEWMVNRNKSGQIWKLK